VTTKIKKFEEPDRISQALLDWLNDHGAQGIITTDDKLLIRSWNHWLEVHTGKKAETMIGQSLIEAFPELTDRKLDAYYKRALEGQSGVLSQRFHTFLLEMADTTGDDDDQMHQSVRISPLVEQGQVIGTVTVIEDVTERVKRESELQHQLEERAQLLDAESAARNSAESASRRLAQLQIVTDEAFAQMDLDDLLVNSVKTIRNIVNADTAAILMAEPNNDLVIRATDGIATDIINARVPAGTGFSGMIALQRRPQTVQGKLPPSPFSRVMEELGIVAASGVPLIVDKRLLGVLVIGTRETQNIREDDLRFISLVGDRIALAIERISLYNAEREARAQAEEANRLKDQFLATVSHELRTPLNAILGWARMLTSGRIDENTSQHALEVIERNARSQAQLIDDLLDVSRIISGKLRLNICPVEPLHIVELALDAVRPAAEAKQIQLQTKLDPQTGSFPADPDRLQQVIWNLLSNAIKFTPSGGKVLVEVIRDDSNIEFKVTDSGQGISPEFLPFVFERFRQGDSTVARMHGGLGLGLAIVRHLTELHGGTVKAYSAGEGQGCIFDVRLPVQLAHLSLHSSDLATASVNEEVSLYFNCPESLQGLRVLIVDDEVDALELMKTVLGECGASTRTATSAAEGLEIIKSDQPDILISDIEMPGEDGYSLIRSIRSLPSSSAREILAVALTAHANAVDQARALAAGFQIHVRKPIEPAVFVETLARLVEGNRESISTLDPTPTQQAEGRRNS